MNLLFICGSLEPGRDGVGDYTRRLAGECIRQGHEASMIAINDAHASTDSELPVVQESDGTPIETLRLPSTMPWAKRMMRASEFVGSKNPDWLSLQYVPYAYNAKGLPLGLAKRLRSLGQGRQWHVMFHELWAGLGISPSFRHQVLRVLQRRMVRGLLRSLKPRQVHTHATPYIDHLLEITERVKRLPLFGNIPIVKHESEMADMRYMCVAFFGTVHDHWDIEATTDCLLTIADSTGKQPVILALGNGGPIASATWTTFRRLGISVQVFGALNAVEISKQLQICDFGLSASCPDLIEKSGCAAAMFEHGLPVLITRNPIWGSKYLKRIKQNCPLAIMGKGEAESGITPKALHEKEPVSQVANQFNQSLALADQTE